MTAGAHPLARLGWSERQEQALAALGIEGAPGRVISEHKGGLFVATAAGERHAIVPGRLRRAAEAGEAVLPTVGDWVVLGGAHGDGVAPVVAIFPRSSVLQRRAAGEREAAQTLAANVDLALLVWSLAAGPGERKLERALAVVRESGAQPVVVLSKSDLCADRATALAAARAVAPGAVVLAVSARTGEGLAELEALLAPGRTAVLLGSSGVGKSTLVNRWMGGEALATGELDAEGKGRHTTTHRELLALPWGALVIDTPGLRELGLWDADEGVQQAFDDIDALAPGCRFRDCAHESEPGCAVRAAVASGELAEARHEGYLKLRRELAAAAAQKDAAARSAKNASDRVAQKRLNELIRTRKR